MVEEAEGRPVILVELPGAPEISGEASQARDGKTDGKQMQREQSSIMPT